MIQLGPNEKILATERRHWLPIVTESASIVFLGIFPFFILIGAEFLPAEAVAVVAAYRALSWFLYSVWLLMLWMIFGISITNYYLDVLIVTTRRVIDVEQLGLFSRNMAELQLENIQDMNVEVKGFIPSFLDYGTLKIQTSGTESEFFLSHVQHPYHVQEIISKARLAISGQPADHPAAPTSGA